MRIASFTAGLVALLTALVVPRAHAQIIQLPEGGVPVKIINQGVLCGPVAPGWALEGDGQSVQPPQRLPEGASRQFGIRVAATADECADAKKTIQLVATGKWPVIDPAGITFFPDEGRLEIRGRDLKGLQVTWRKKIDGIDGQGVEWCLEPSVSDSGEICTIPVSRNLPIDAGLYWLPAHADTAENGIIHDDLGNRVSRDRFQLHPARIVLPDRLHTRDGIDISKGPGLVPLLYPDAVASVDCGRARCELTASGVLVRGVAGPTDSVVMRLTLAPRVFVMEKGVLTSTLTQKLPLLSCPISVVSGLPLRDVPEPRVVVKMDGNCGGDAGRLVWAVGGYEAHVERVVQGKGFVYVLLGTERLLRDSVTITATRPGVDEVVIGSTTEKTMEAPNPRVTLELENHGKVAFIPTNRPALMSVAPAGEDARFVPMSLPGAYHVATSDGRVAVRGDENAGGFASLRFGYRVSSLPAELADTNLAVISEPVQREVRQASVPASFGVIDGGKGDPLVEVLCADAAGVLHRVPPGKPWRVDHQASESCRIVIHRERLRPEDGLQEIVLEVDVRQATGALRPGAGLRERMVLRPGAEPKVFWIRGGVGQFDRITVRLTHVVDEERYVLSQETREGLPAAQWTVVISGGRLRLYATATIPAGLFRVNSPSGELRLNFGVLSRLTWLDELGTEGLLGAEVGVVGLGLVASRGNLSEFPPTLGAVAGIGLRVPLGSGAAVGVHGWLTYEFREEFSPEGPGGEPASHVAFVFGPSISIGNVGTNL